MTITSVALAMLLGLGGAKYANEGEATDTPIVSEPPTTEIVEPSTDINKPSTDITEPGTDVKEPETPTEDNKFDWQEWAKEFLSPQVITTITTLLAFLATIIKLAYSLKDLKKKNQLTIEAVNDLVINEMKKVMPEEISSNIGKYMPEIVAYEKKSNDIMIAFSKILALAQENTPEARTAILNIIQELGILNNATIDSAKETIAKQEETKKAEEIKKADDVQKIIEETEKKSSKETFDGTSL